MGWGAEGRDTLPEVALELERRPEWRQRETQGGLLQAEATTGAKAQRREQAWDVGGTSGASAGQPLCKYPFNEYMERSNK